MMNLRKRAAETLEDVSVTSRKVGDTAELASLAMFAVVGVSLAALVIAVIALERSNR